MRTAFYKYVGLGLIAFTLTTASAQDRNEGSREQIELKRKMKEVRQKEFNEINAVFTPEQKATLKELHAKKHQNKKGAN